MRLTGRNVAAALVQAFGSLKAAALAVECNESTLRRWATGRAQPQVRHLSQAREAILARAEELRLLAETMRANVS